MPYSVVTAQQDSSTEMVKLTIKNCVNFQACCSVRDFAKIKKFPKSEITMEVGGWVQGPRL